MQSRTVQFENISKARVARKRSARKRQSVRIQDFCYGQLRRFISQVPPVSDLHDWRSPCQHLESGFICGLLADHDFEKLTDPGIARCTLPEVVLISEWFLDDYLGFYFRSSFEPPRTNGNLRDKKSSTGDGDGSVISIGRATVFRATSEETIEMDLDYRKILSNLRESGLEWKWGYTPLNWFKHIEIQTHRYVRSLLKSRIPCGSCNHFRALDGRCILRNVRKHQTGRGCSSYKPMVVDSSNLIAHHNSAVSEKIIWRLITLLARAVEEAADKPRLANKLERLHLTVLEWVSEGSNGNRPRKSQALQRGVSAKTIDRDKRDLAMIFRKFRKTDPELQRLFVRLEIAEDLFSDIPEIHDSLT